MSPEDRKRSLIEDKNLSEFRRLITPLQGAYPHVRLPELELRLELSVP